MGERLVSRADLAVLCGYAVFFLALLVQYPLRGAIAGNCDSWFVIALGNGYWHLLEQTLDAGAATTSMYPAPNALLYGESAPGFGLLWVLLRAFGLGDIVSFYLFLSILLSLSAWGVYLVARCYVGRPEVAAFAGFAFGTSNFLFANIDDCVVAFYFVAALSVVFFKRYVETGEPADLVRSGALAGAQIYFSAYVFVLMAVWLAVVALANHRSIRRHGLLRLVCPFATFVALVAVPWVATYTYTLAELDVFNPYSTASVTVSNSLRPGDLVRPLPDNLLYSTSGPVETDIFWVALRRHAFVGYGLVLLAIVGACRRPLATALLGLVIAGLAIALGPPLGEPGSGSPTLVRWIQEVSPLAGFFRVPLRGYFLTVLGLAILAARGAETLIGRFPAKRRGVGALFLVAVTSLHALENIPVPLRGTEAASLVRAPNAYREFFEDLEGAVILDLPSELGLDFRDSELPLFRYSREIVYMNWQTQHGRDVIGGVNGYLPKSRVRLHLAILDLPALVAVAALSEAGVTHLVVHPGLYLPGERSILAELESSPFLFREHRSRDLVIFRIDRDALDRGEL